MGKFATYSKAVDVLTSKGWQTFESIKAAAAFIGCSHSFLSVSLRKDIQCRGYQIRHHLNEES